MDDSKFLPADPTNHAVNLKLANLAMNGSAPTYAHSTPIKANQIACAMCGGHGYVDHIPERERGVPGTRKQSTSPAASQAPSIAPSLYSQWGDEDESSDEGEAFWGTPDAALSEVEEEEDAQVGRIERNAAANRKAGVVANGVPGGKNRIATRPRKASTASVSSLGIPKLQRYLASGAKVEPPTIAYGNPRDVNQAAALGPDLDLCREALRLFLSSNMKEAEALLADNDPHNNHLYLQAGTGLIQSLKGFLTFDAVDLHAALDVEKATANTATALRRPSGSVFSKIGGLVSHSQALARVRAMTPLERHAELSYAETILIKALLSIVAGGDWVGLIREALNMRTAHGIYQTLQKFLDEADKKGFDDDIDMDFRSGVLLGTGTSSLMLSLLPGKVLKLAEVFGYAGDRKVALETLMAAGGWDVNSPLPAYDESNEGVRRPICDMILLTFHLVISVLMPVAGVDIPTARKILNYNITRYPNGIFFLYFQARMHTNECEPELANASIQRALNLELEYVQLQHMCLWDYGCNNLQLNDWKASYLAFDILRKESNWSRAVYTYATAVNVMELIGDPNVPGATQEYAQHLVLQLPKLAKKIAGKSVPLEKLCQRKARKYVSQNNRLFLPAMELGYVFGSLGSTPRRLLLSRWLPRIDKELARLERTPPEQWGNGTGWWDDYVLGHFLRAVVQSTACYQPKDASENARRPLPGQPSNAELDAGAERDFRLVIEHAPKVELDHYIVYHNHYEFGRFFARRGDAANAKAQFDIVASGKLPVPNPHVGKGKYSMEGALQLKNHAAATALTSKDGKDL